MTALYLLPGEPLDGRPSSTLNGESAPLRTLGEQLGGSVRDPACRWHQTCAQWQSVRRSLIVLGTAAAVLILGFVALFAIGGSDDVSSTGASPALTTTTTTPTPTTQTTIVNLIGSALGPKRTTLVLVTVPNVVGMPLAQAALVLAAVGLTAGTETPANKTGGQSTTGTILGQSPAAGSKMEQGASVRLSISGY